MGGVVVLLQSGNKLSIHCVQILILPVLWTFEFKVRDGENTR
jgi:hypothetical protein